MKRLAKFLEVGLEVLGNYNQMSYILGEDKVERFEGKKSFTLSDSIKATIDLENFKVDKIIDSKGTYLKYQGTFVIDDKCNVLTEEGELISLEDMVNNFEKIKCKGISKGDMVVLKDINTRKVALLPEVVTLYKDIDICGEVHSIDESDGCVIVKTSKEYYKVPFQCISKVDKLTNDELSALARKLKTEIKFDDMLFPELDPKNRQVTYIQKSRIPRFNGDFWNKELRDKYCVATNVEKAFDVLFKGQDRELVLFYFAFLFEREKLMESIKGEILHGDEINQVFYSKNIVRESTLGNSCMMDTYSSSGWKGEKKFYIYTQNKNCSCAIIRNNEGKIVARAMLWNARNIKDGKVYKIMDRIYSARNEYIEQMQFFAFSMGALCLPVQKKGTREFIDLEDKKYDAREFFVELDSPITHEYYPYLDTFGTIVADRLFADGAIYIRARKTSGDVSAHNLYYTE